MDFLERIKEFRYTYEETGSTYQAGLLIPDVVDDKYFETIKPEQEFYKCRNYYRKNEIDSSVLQQRLNELAKENVSINPIFTYSKRKKAFLEEKKKSVKEQLLQELNEKEDVKEKEFYENEKKIEKEENLKLQIKYKNKLVNYENIFNPTEEWLEEKYKNYSSRIIEKWGETTWIISASSIRLLKMDNGQNRYAITFFVENLSEYAERFPYKYSITPAGNESRRLKTDKQIEEEYAQNVCALAFVYAVSLFNVCFDVKEVLVNCHSEYIDSSTGNEEEKCLYSVIISRELVKTYRMENLNTVAAIMSLEGNADIRKERDIYYVEPLLWKLNEDEETDYEENEDELIKIDFRKLNVDLFLTDDIRHIFETFETNHPDFKQLCFNKVKELQMYEDNFDSDNYSNGLYKFLLVLRLIQMDGKTINSNNHKILEFLFKTFFGENQYAMDEIKKLINNDIFIRIINGEKVNVDVVTFAFINYVLSSENTEQDESVENISYNSKKIITVTVSEASDLLMDLESGNYTIELKGPISNDDIDDITLWLSNDKLKINLLLPEGITEIENYAFDCCASLESIKLPESIIEIGNEAFSNCSSLKSINIPKNVKKIGDGAFWGCSSLSEIKIPNTVIEIGEFAFNECFSLKSIVIPGSLKRIGNNLCNNCTSLEEVIISAGIKKIPWGMFAGCSSLSKISIPESVIEIEEQAFLNCSIHELETKCLKIRDGFAFSYDDTEIDYCTDSSSPKIVIPSYIECINSYAFYGNEKLKEIIIPDTVSKIEDFTFADCKALKRVFIPEGVIEIGKEAFSSCTSLKEIVLPETVLKVGEKAFEYCRSLEHVFIPKNCYIGDHAFPEKTIVTRI